MKEYTFKKSTCERYDIKFGGWGWAIITIDERGGLFNCQSDYGTYAYTWPNHGSKTFKHFLIEISKSPDYLLKKVAQKTYFDFDSHLEKWKKTIFKMRKEHEITKDQTRELFDFLDYLDSGASYDLIQMDILSNDLVSDLGAPWDIFEMDKDYTPDAYGFVSEVMPIFASILKNEIEGDG